MSFTRRHFLALSAAGALPAHDAVSVTRFGILPDSANDVTADLQRAVDSGVGTLWFPKGVYRVSGTVTVDLAKTGFTSLSGDGTALIKKDGPGAAFHFTGTHQGTAGPTTVQDQVWQSERMPLVSGIAIEGSHPESVGICLQRTFQPTLTNVLIRQCRLGVHLKERNRNLLISHCHIYHNHEIGVLFDRVNLHQAIIGDSHVSYNKVAGIKIDGGEVRNFQICGNDIEYNHDEDGEESADILFDSRAEGSTFREGTIVGNTIQARPSPKGANIRILGGAEQRTSGLLAISGNLIGSQTDNIHLKDCRSVTISGNAIYSATNRTLVLEDSANIIVSDNTVDWNPDHKGKVMVDGVTINRCKGVQFNGNIIENSFAGSDEAGGTVEILNSEDVSITNCQILDPKHRGIVVSGSKRCRISGSTVLDRKQPVTMLQSVMIDKTSSGCVVSDNILHRAKHSIAKESALIQNNSEVHP